MWTISKLPLMPRGTRIAICGPMASGKTTAADYLVRHHGYKKIALADKLKGIAYELYGITGKDGDSRRILQELGDALRVFDDEVFIKYTINLMAITLPKDKVVIDDLRLPREAELLRNVGFNTIGIVTPFEVRQERIARLYPLAPAALQGHATEVSWQSIPLDASISSVDAADLTALDTLVSNYDTN